MNRYKNKRANVAALSNVAVLSTVVGVSGLMSSMAANSQGIAIEEILVTAQKRSENIMDVPISITALTADSLQRSKISGMDDIQMVVPGIEFRRQVAAMAPFIRGIGSQNATVIGFEPSVALYIDGVYQSLPLTNGIGFKNVERVEVLKGPQGTLFGRNATGGAVNVITKVPQQEPSASVKLGYGNFDTSTTEFYGTTGVTDTLAVDLSLGYTDQQEGYGDNIILNKDVNKQRAVTARNKWIWEPTEETTANLSFSYDKTTESPGSARAIAPGTKNQFGVPALDDFYDTRENFFEAIDTGNSNFDGHAAATESKAVTLRLDHSFDSFDLVSITGYIDQEAFILVDNDSSEVSAVHAQLPFFNDQISQEFQFLSNNEGPFSWIGGLYYMMAEQKYDIFTVRAIPGFPIDRVEIDNSLDISSAAAFAEVGYEFTEQTKLTVGLRWTKEEKELEGITNACVTDTFCLPLLALVGAPPPYEYSEKETWNEPTWRVVLNHNFTNDVMGYASYSRGFKSGAYNTVVDSGVPQAALEPEILDAFELGTKGMFMDSALSLTAATFYYEFSDMHVQQSRGFTQVFLNAATAEIYGAELNGTLQASDNLQFRAGVAYTHGEFDEFEDGPVTTPLPGGGNSVGAADLAGNKLPRTPEWTASIAIDHSLPTDIGTFDSNLTYYYNDGIYWEVDNRYAEGSYGLIGARFAWTEPQERYGIELWGKNLADEEYALYGVANADADSYSAAAPRTYGLSVIVNF